MQNYNRICRDSAIGKATDYWLDGREFGARVPVKSRIFISPCRPDWLWGSPNLLSNGFWTDSILFRGLGWDRVHCVSRPAVGLLYLSRMTDEYGTIGGMRIGRRNRSTRRKSAPVPIFPLQVPHGLIWDQRQAATVTNRLNYGTAFEPNLVTFSDISWPRSWSREPSCSNDIASVELIAMCAVGYYFL
jgi:hypothetical protein